MRIRTLLMLGSIVFAAATVSAQALTLPSSEPATRLSSDLEQVAARHCNRGFHWVHSHHARDGRLIHGQCVRDHHR